MWFRKKTPIDAVIDGNSYQLDSRKTVLDNLLATNASIPYNCQVGACKKCMLEVLEGEVKSLIDLRYCLTSEQISQGYILACQAMPRTRIVARSCGLDESDSGNGPVEAAIVGVEKLSAYVYRVSFSYFDSAKPGASLEVNMPQLGESRYYSVSCINEGESVSIDVAKKNAGHCSTWLCDKRNVGQPVTIECRKGELGSAPGTPSQVIAIAGGAGLGMIMTVLENSLDRYKNTRIDLIHAVRHSEDTYDRGRVAELQRIHGNLNVCIAVSRDSIPTNEFFNGRVPELLAKMMADKEIAPRCRFIMCGSESLAGACRNAINKMRLTDVSFEIESFGL